MRQRTLGILAAAFLVAGAAVGTGTAIYAFQTGASQVQATTQAPTGQRGPLHRPQFGGPLMQPGPGRGGGPLRPRGGPGF